MDEEKATPDSGTASKESRAEAKPSHGDTSTAAQRRKALELLRAGPKSTLQLRREGDILAPAARIVELRRRGVEIITHWVHQATKGGKLHRVALYVLLCETGGQA